MQSRRTARVPGPLGGGRGAARRRHRARSGPSPPTTPSGWSASTSRSRTSRSTTASSRPTRACPTETCTASPTTTTSTGWASPPRSAASSSPPSATTASTPRACPPRRRPTRPRSPSSSRTPTRAAGVASALLEHIAAVARERGIRRFAAEVLPANSKMIKVFTDAGYTQQRSFEDGVVRLEFDLEPTDALPGRACAPASSAPRRAPYSGCSPPAPSPSSAPAAPRRRRPHACCATSWTPGFTGRVHAVNHAFPDGQSSALDGVPAHRSVARDRRARWTSRSSPSPPSRCPTAVADCGEHGVQGLVVLSAGYAESGPRGPRAAARTGPPGPLVRHADHRPQRLRHHQHRAPASGSTPPSPPRCPAAGRIGLFTQSGAIGIALLSGLHRRGAGDGVAGVSPSSPRATAPTSPATTSSSTGTTTRTPTSSSCTWSPSATRASSPGSPGAPPPSSRSWSSRAPGTPAPPRPATPSRRPGIPRQHGLRAAAAGGRDPRRHRHRTGRRRACCSPPSRCPRGPRVAILGNSESLGLLTYDACLDRGAAARCRRCDLTTAAAPGGLPRRARRGAGRRQLRRRRRHGHPGRRRGLARRRGPRRGPARGGGRGLRPSRWRWCTWSSAASRRPCPPRRAPRRAPRRPTCACRGTGRRTAAAPRRRGARGRTPHPRLPGRRARRAAPSPRP